MNHISHTITKTNQTYKLSELLKNQAIKTGLLLELTIVLTNTCTTNLIDDIATTLIQRINLTIICQKQSSLYLHGILTTKTATLERKITIKLDGIQAHASAFYQGTTKKDQIIKINTEQHHAIAHTTSNLTVKMVLDDAAKFNCNSLIYVAPAAEQVSAQQVNKNLLLNPLAVATSSPKLEVLSHQVKCSHGAAMSYLDTEKLFFLQSRGFNQTQAKKLLIKSFLQP